MTTSTIASGTAAGKPNGDLTGTVKIRGRVCEFSGLLTTAEGAEFRDDPKLAEQLVLYCRNFECDDECYYSFTGVRRVRIPR
jgi:hypothetical protein